MKHQAKERCPYCLRIRVLGHCSSVFSEAKTGHCRDCCTNWSGGSKTWKPKGAVWPRKKRRKR